MFLLRIEIGRCDIMPIDPSNEKYRRRREPAANVQKNPLIFRRFCNFYDRKESSKYAAEIEALHYGLIRNLAKTGRKKEAVIEAVEKKDRKLSHFFLSSEMTGYELLGYKNNPDCDEKMGILNKELEAEYGISMDSYVAEYLNKLREEDEKEKKFGEAKREIIKDAMETRGGLVDNLILKEIDKIAAGLLTPKYGITDYELITGKKPEITEFGEVLRKEVKKEFGVSLPYYVQRYVDELVDQTIKDSYDNSQKPDILPEAVEFV